MGQHEVNVGARVRSRDGKKLGVIKQRWFTRGRIGSMASSSGKASSPKIVPADLVTATDGSGLVLGIDKANVAELPTVIHEQLLRSSGPIYDTGNQWVLRGPSGGQPPEYRCRVVLYASTHRHRLHAERLQSEW